MGQRSPEIVVATGLVTAVAHRVSRVEAGVGVVMPTLVPPLAAGALGWMLAGRGGIEAAPLAYISGTLGCLIGADLLRLRAVVTSSSSGILSIGGAGLFDGFFLVGVIAAVLS